MLEVYSPGRIANRHPLLKSTILALTTLLLHYGSAMAPAAWAQYRPPQGDPPRGSTIANSSRGFRYNRSRPPLLILAPIRHVGRSSSTNPILSWFISLSEPYRIEISFYKVLEDGSLDLVFLHEDVQSTRGMIRTAFPELTEILHMGERYRWQVAVAEDPADPDDDLAFTAEIDLVAPDLDLETQLATATTPAQKAEIYAEAGYWYDALREATDPQLSSFLEQLAALESGLQKQFLYRIAADLD
jgi:hypothetical protein